MHKYSNKKVGILIPTFNREHFLKYSLESALHQTTGDICIIVLDNGSTDHTRDYMGTIRDNRVSYIINEQNIGLIGSINKGVDLFPGDVEWCTILCDDDRLSRDFIEIMRDTIKNRSAKSIIHSHRIFIRPDGGKIREALDSVDEESGLEYVMNRSKNLRETYLTGVLFNRYMFKKIGCYPNFTTGVGTDDAFIFALSVKDRLVYQRNTHVFITIHPGAESQEYRNFRNVFQTIKEVTEYCKNIYSQENLPRKISNTEMQLLMSKYKKRIYTNICLGQFWRRDLHGNELNEFLDVISRNKKDLPIRINTDVLLKIKYNVDAEKYFSYRAAWGLIELLQNKFSFRNSYLR